MPSQSSSAPLQLSAGGLQVPQAHDEVHVREPVEPHPVVHVPLEPAQQVDPSSHVESQSSSVPLQTSVGGVQLPHVQLEVHVRDPVVPQLEVQLPVVPGTHVNVSSIVPSQSSSVPLHVSLGGAQLPQVQSLRHVRLPVDPQVVVQEPLEPCTQVNPSSATMSQSSSAPLQTSAGGVQLPHEHVELHVREPVVPQLDVQEPLEP
jgi:hypothetical protein